MGQRVGEYELADGKVDAWSGSVQPAASASAWSCI